MKALLIVLTILFPLTLTVFAQSLQERIKQVPDAKKFTVEYDKFKDLTTLSTYVRFRNPHAGTRGNRINATLQCGIRSLFSGTELHKDSELFSLICGPMYSFGYWQFLEDHHLIFLLDGVRLDLRDGKHGGTVDDEYVIYLVTRDDIQKLGEAKQIEIQFGSYEGIIEKDGQPRIKTLLDLATKKGK